MFSFTDMLLIFVLFFQVVNLLLQISGKLANLRKPSHFQNKSKKPEKDEFYTKLFEPKEGGEQSLDKSQDTRQ